MVNLINHIIIKNNNIVCWFDNVIPIKEKNIHKINIYRSMFYINTFHKYNIKNPFSY